MRLLLTGATGFVGRNILLRAVEENRYYEIVVPIRSREKLMAQFLGDGYEGIPASIRPIVCDANNWDFSEESPFDHVIHSAGVVFARSRGDYFETNVDGTVRLLKTLKSPGRIALLSSQSAAGPCPPGRDRRREGDRDEPITWYGQSKLEMEKKIARDFSHLNCLCIRPPMIFGPRDQATLPLFKMAKNRIHFKAGWRNKHYSFIAVSDLVSAIFSVLRSSGEWEKLPQKYFFVAADEAISDRDLLKGTAEVSKKRGILLTVPHSVLKGVAKVVDSIPIWRETIPSLSADRAKEIWPERWVVSSKAFQKKFGWQPTEDLGSVLKQTHDWYVRTGQLA